jgi:hypothetical protein
VIDGNSISQQPGSLTTSLILKHKYTFLNEVYPRVLGLNAGSSNIFCLNVPVKYNPASIQTNIAASAQESNLLATIQQLYGYAADELRTDSQIIEFIVQLCKAIVNSQTISEFLIPTEMYKNSTNSLMAAIEAGELNAENMAPIILTLLNNINYSYTNGLTLLASDPSICSKVIGDLSLLENSLLDALIKMVGEYGCVVVIGNNHAYIIPDAPYLTIPKTARLRTAQKSTQYNLALPANYEDFNFNDAGENTIKGVYVVPEATGNPNVISIGGASVINGFYNDPNPKTFGNIVVKTLPQIATAAMSYAAFHGGFGIQQNIINQSPLISTAVETDEAKTGMDFNYTAMSDSVLIPLQNYMNQWAELEYCRIKYGDRTGSITMPFNNNWTPGAVGSIYTRQPGTYVDFYVNEVVHSFSASSPNNGSATTAITFSGGRPGGSNNSIDVLSLYNYSYNNNLNFCRDFTNDIGYL